MCLKFTARNGAIVHVPDEQLAGMGLSDLGYCVNCGNEQAAEPDAQHYRCEVCDHRAVNGTEILLVAGVLS
jgi:hypothetical protein